MKKPLFAVACVCACLGAGATDYVWTNGGGDSNWNTAANWTPNGVPKAGDRATFTAAATVAGDVALGDEGVLTIDVPGRSDRYFDVALTGVISGGAGVCVDGACASGTYNAMHTANAVSFANAANTFTGPFSVASTCGWAIRVKAAALADAGQPSSFGAGAGENAVLTFNGGSIYVKGSSTTVHKTNRPFYADGHFGNFLADVCTLEFTGPVTGTAMAFRLAGTVHFHQPLLTQTSLSRTDGGNVYFHCATNACTVQPSCSAGAFYFTSVSNRNVVCGAGKGKKINLGQQVATTAKLHFNWTDGVYVPGDLATDRDLYLLFAPLSAGAKYRNYAPTLYNDAAGTTLEWNGAVYAQRSSQTPCASFKVDGAGDGVFAKAFASGETQRLVNFEFRKFGAGTWTLCGANIYTGVTEVAEGRLNVGCTGKSASLAAGVGVLVQSGATFGGEGTLACPVSVVPGGILAAGGATALGTNRLACTTGAALTLAKGAAVAIKVDPVTGACDVIDASDGTVSLGGDVSVSISALGGGAVPDGRYTFLKAGTLERSGASFVSDAGVFKYNADGSVALVVGAEGIVWRGDAANNVWDKSTANWMDGEIFADGASVTFDARGVSSVPVEVTTDVAPFLVNVGGDADWAFAGAGRIAGDALVKKSGAGALVFSNAVACTGGIEVSGGDLTVAGKMADTPISIVAGGAFRQSPTARMEGAASIAVGVVGNVFAGTNAFTGGALVYDPTALTTSSVWNVELPPPAWLSGIADVTFRPRANAKHEIGLRFTKKETWGEDAAAKTIWVESAAETRVFELSSSKDQTAVSARWYSDDFYWPGALRVKTVGAGTTIVHMNFSGTVYLGTKGGTALAGFGGSSNLRRGAAYHFLGRVDCPDLTFAPNDGVRVHFYTAGGHLSTVENYYGAITVHADDALPTEALYHTGKDGTAWGLHGSSIDLETNVQHVACIVETSLRGGGDRVVTGKTGSRFVVNGPYDSSFGSVCRFRKTREGDAKYGTYAYTVADEGEVAGTTLCQGRITGGVALEMASAGHTFKLNASTNTFTGDVIVSAGTLVANTPGSLGCGTGAATDVETGAGDKNLHVTGGTLKLNAAQNEIFKAALRIGAADGTAGVVEVAEGVTQRVKFLHVGGKYMARGVYGSAESGAAKQLACFAGKGTVLVTSGQSGSVLVVR